MFRFKVMTSELKFRVGYFQDELNDKIDVTLHQFSNIQRGDSRRYRRYHIVNPTSV